MTLTGDALREMIARELTGARQRTALLTDSGEAGTELSVRLSGAVTPGRPSTVVPLKFTV